MDPNNLRDWNLFYKSEHKVYAHMISNFSIETYVIILLKKPEVNMGFKMVMRNVKNELNFYSSHVSAGMYNDLKRTHNLYSEFGDLHRNMKMILEANKSDPDQVVIRLDENANGICQIKIVSFNRSNEETLFFYPILAKSSFYIAYFLKQEMEYEQHKRKKYMIKKNGLEKELEKQGDKYAELLAQYQLKCEKITQLEARNEQLWIENYQSRMHLIVIDSANKINFRQLLAAEETIKHLNNVIIELSADQNSSNFGVTQFTRSVSSLSENIEIAVRTPMPQYQLLNMLDIFSTGVLELANVATNLTRIMVSRQEPDTMNMQFRSAVLSQTRMIAVLQEMWKGNRLTIEDAKAVRKMVEEVTNEVVRKFGNRPAEGRLNVANAFEVTSQSVSVSEESSGSLTVPVSETETASGSAVVSGPRAETGIASGSAVVIIVSTAETDIASGSAVEIVPTAETEIVSGHGTASGSGTAFRSETPPESGIASRPEIPYRSGIAFRPGTSSGSGSAFRAEISSGSGISYVRGVVPRAGTSSGSRIPYGRGIASRPGTSTRSRMAPRSETPSESGISFRPGTSYGSGIASGPETPSGSGVAPASEPERQNQ